MIGFLIYNFQDNHLNIKNVFEKCKNLDKLHMFYIILYCIFGIITTLVTINLSFSNNPTILLNKNYITQLWPSQSMTFEEKLNAISRLVLLLTILGFFITRNTNIIIIGILTLAIIYTMYKFRKDKTRGKRLW